MRPAAATFATLVCIAPGAALAADPFEIQVYDGTANPAGVPGLELHANQWATGHRAADAPELPLHGQFHATLEPSLGMTSFWELGAYMQFAVRTDAGRADWAGVKLRSKFVTPPTWDAHWRLGVNLELSYLPETYDRSRWGSEVRPIVAWQDERWLFAINPIVGTSLAPPSASEGPSLEPAVKVARALGPVALGFEYYASLGPIGSPLPIRAQEHYLYEVVDVVGVSRVEVNAGVGEGLTEASAGIVLKLVLGVTLDGVFARAPGRGRFEGTLSPGGVGEPADGRADGDRSPTAAPAATPSQPATSELWRATPPTTPRGHSR
jgi:hypothetical protein